MTPLTARALAALNTVWNALQVSDPVAAKIPVEGLDSLCTRGLLERWEGQSGGTFYMVTAEGKQAICRGHR